MTINEIIKLIEEQISAHQFILKNISDKDPFRDRDSQYRIGAIHALKDLLQRIKEQAA